MRTLAVLLLFVACARGEPPQAPPLRDYQAPAVRVESLPPIDFDLSALRAPEVAAPRPFQRGSYWSSHNCPECGRLVLAKSGRAAPGQHWHVCACGSFWRHEDK